jgi:hypothetical protein
MKSLQEELRKQSGRKGSSQEEVRKLQEEIGRYPGKIMDIEEDLRKASDIVEFAQLQARYEGLQDPQGKKSVSQHKRKSLILGMKISLKSSKKEKHRLRRYVRIVCSLPLLRILKKKRAFLSVDQLILEKRKINTLNYPFCPILAAPGHTDFNTFGLFHLQDRKIKINFPVPPPVTALKQDPFSRSSLLPGSPQYFEFLIRPPRV